VGLDDAVRSIVSRRDPDGFYVIIASSGARELLEKMGVEYEEYGSNIIVRVKSRRTAEELAKTLYRRGYLEA